MYELYHLLEPGERVVYRARKARRPICGVVYFAAISAAFTLAITLEPQSSAIPWIDLGFAGLLWGFVFWVATVISRNALLVTDRRVLHRSGRGKTIVTAISLGEITKLRRLPRNFLEIQDQDGAKITPEFFRCPEELAQALAHAGGLAMPEFPGAKERLLQALCTSVEILACVVSLLLIFATGLFSQNSVGVLESAFWFFALITVSFSIFSAIYLASLLLVVVVARAFMNAEEMRKALCRDADVNWPNRMLVALLLSFAGLLYDRPLRCEAVAEEAEAGDG